MNLRPAVNLDLGEDSLAIHQKNTGIDSDGEGDDCTSIHSV